MAHAHRTARYQHLLRQNPQHPAPSLTGRVTVANVREWKARSRAYDEARLRLGFVTATALQRANSALNLKPGTSRILTFARY